MAIAGGRLDNHAIVSLRCRHCVERNSAYDGRCIDDGDCVGLAQERQILQSAGVSMLFSSALAIASCRA